jgi:hypothetical protein
VPNETLLRNATVQEIQLELIRRTQFNAMDGQRVYDSLVRQRDLWSATILDRQGFERYDKPRGLLTSGLIKLRDLPGNCWNADTLFILTDRPDNAHRLARIIEDEDWGGEVQVYTDTEQVCSALGTGRENYALVTVWWD